MNGTDGICIPFLEAGLVRNARGDRDHIKWFLAMGQSKMEVIGRPPLRRRELWLAGVADFRERLSATTLCATTQVSAKERSQDAYQDCGNQVGPAAKVGAKDLHGDAAHAEHEKDR